MRIMKLRASFMVTSSLMLLTIRERAAKVNRFLGCVQKCVRQSARSSLPHPRPALTRLAAPSMRRPNRRQSAALQEVSLFRRGRQMVN
jgi:hypothetical protein